MGLVDWHKKVASVNRDLRNGLLFVSPWLLGFSLLVVFPFLASLYWSFCEYDLLTPPKFVGTVHYQRLADEILKSEGFGRALWNTGYYAAVSVPLSIIMGIGLAVIVSWPVRGRAAYRTILFLPSVVPVVASSVLWMWLLDAQSGLVNHVLGYAQVPTSPWFKGTQEAAWLPGWFSDGILFGSKDALVLMAVWGVGNFMVIYMAALSDVPKTLYEAAAIDGAGPIRRFCSITLPMLSPVIFFNLVMGLIQSVQAFTQIYIVSEGTGAPAGSTLVLSLHLFLSAFQDLDMGYASAIAWIMFVVLLLVTAGMFRLSRGWVFYAGVRP